MFLLLIFVFLQIIKKQNLKCRICVLSSAAHLEQKIKCAFMIVISYKVNSLFGAKRSFIFALFRWINTAQKLLNDKFGISHHTTVHHYINNYFKV